ncbi:MAG: hypothetical protein LBJ20_05850, partial [Candidatus Methanoplasma sp.]|nr:hypothetical protein [Candidatus Methanoplasma sp.]
MVAVRVSCPVYPSEDKEKVKSAVMSIFPDAVLETAEHGLEGTATADMFRELIRRQKILDSTRAMMFRSVRGNKIVLHLNKQVASVGKVSFTEPKTVLGTLQVTIECDDPEALIDIIAPKTVD